MRYPYSLPCGLAYCGHKSQIFYVILKVHFYIYIKK